MKKLLLILIVVLFASCSQMIFVCDYEHPDFESADDIINYVQNNFTYCLDWDSSNASINDWQTPQVTQQIKTGDCDDFTIYFIENYYQISGVKVSMQLVKLSGGGLHYWAVYDGYVYDATGGFIVTEERAMEAFDYTELDTLPFSLVFPTL